MPLRRKFAVAVKIEASPGVAETLNTAEDLIPNCFDADIQPSITIEEREAGGNSLSAHRSHAAARGGTATFTVELTGDDDPAWATKLLPALGFGGAAGEYTPESRKVEAPGSLAKTVTIGVYRDGRLKRLRGAMGTATFRFTSGGRMIMECEFTGIWVDVTNVATPSPALLSPLRFASATLTIGSFVPKIAEITIALNNEVVLREDATDASAYYAAAITGRAIGGTINPEATLVGTHGAAVWTPHADMIAETLRELTITRAPLSFDAPNLQIINTNEEDRNSISIDQVDYLLVRDAAAGEDELVITTPTS
jgi:hypothetical protein